MTKLTCGSCQHFVEHGVGANESFCGKHVIRLNGLPSYAATNEFMMACDGYKKWSTNVKEWFNKCNK